MMNKLIKRHYNAIVARGQINIYTTKEDFIAKMEEEYNEVLAAYNKTGSFDGDFAQEAIDLVAVIFNALLHYGYNIEEEVKFNVEHQEGRI